MTSFFRFFKRSNTETGRGKGKTSIRNRTLQLESLENRELLSVTAADLDALASANDFTNAAALVSEETLSTLIAQAEAIDIEDLTEEFVLSQASNTYADHTIYLDFKQYRTAASSQWGAINSPAFDIDGDADNFNQEELALMYGIWQIVSEYFRPFNVNVTTANPGSEKMLKTSTDDGEFGIRVAIGGYHNWFSSNIYAEGTSKFDTFSDVSSVENPAFVFSQTIYNAYFNSASTYDRLLYATKVAAIAAREVGHAMGAEYEPRLVGIGNEYNYTYLRGHEIGDTDIWWTSMMGSGYAREQTIYQWSNSQQNTINAITSNGIALRGDETDESRIIFDLDSLEVSRSGVIATQADSDTYLFTVDATDNYHITVSAGVTIPEASRQVSSLYFRVILRDADGTVLHSQNVPLTTQSISFGRTLTSGEYSITVEGIGYSASPGFGSFGSRGMYTIQMIRNFVPTPRPTGVSIEQTGPGTVRLSWRYSERIRTYNVYRWDGADGWVQILTTENSYAEFTDQEAGYYLYYVTAVSDYDIESEPSLTQFIQVVEIHSPDNFTVEQVGAGVLQFGWEPVDHVSKYYVYRKNNYSQWIVVGESTGTTLTLSGVANGTHTFAVAAVGVYTSDLSPEQTIMVGNVSVPILSAASQTGLNRVSLAWYAVNGATAYNVYRLENGTRTLVGTTTTTSIELSDQAAGTHVYAVSAINPAYESSLSNTKQITITDLVVPTGLSIVQTQAAGIELSWNPVAQASTYNVYRRESNGTWTLVLNTTNTSAPFVGLTAGGTYTYAVSAAVAGYESDRSAAVEISLASGTAPGKPGVTQTAPNTVELTWMGVPGVGQYNVYQKYGDENWVKIDTVAGTTTTLTGLALGNYSFRITAVQASAESRPSTETSITLGTFFAPTGLLARQTAAETVALSWNAVAGAEQYYVYRQNADSSWSRIATVADSAKPTYTVTGVPPGNYNFAVSSVGNYESDRSSSVNAMVFGVAAPAALHATPLNNGVTLSWSRVTGASAYYIYQKSDDGSWNRIDSVSGTTTATLTDLSSGAYVFVVTAYGFYESSYSPEVSVVVSSINAPSSVAAAPVDDTSVRLSWDAVDGVTSYDIYRKTGDSAWAHVETVTETSATISGLASGTHVFAVSSANGLEESAFSEEQSVTLGSEDIADPPEAPTGLRIDDRTSQTLSLTWQTVPGAVYYELQRKGLGDSDFTTVYFGGDSSYVDTGLDPDAEYSYQVRAIAAPLVSSWSSEMLARTKAAATPSTGRPTIIEATLKNGVVSIQWEDLGPDHTYVLFKNGIPVLGYTEATSYIDTNPATTNTYVVYSYSTALNRWLWSPQRVISTSSVQATFLDYEYTASGGIRLNWVDNGLSYVLFRSGIPVAANLTEATWTDENPIDGENEYILYIYSNEGSQGRWIWSSAFLVSKPVTSAKLTLDSFWTDYALTD